jgi:hypothetical protein
MSPRVLAIGGTAILDHAISGETKFRGLSSTGESHHLCLQDRAIRGGFVSFDSRANGLISLVTGFGPDSSVINDAGL